MVGTHRLLSRDVRFHDLGLLVVDEEQRFGVTHKERLKELRTQVDVLTLTATPIPRTLQMAMGGLREISIIATPPADRLAIRTTVCRCDRDLLGEAIRRERARGGQIFFVHNRIEDLAEQAGKIREISPEGTRIAIAHGQMPEGELEKVMVDFVDGRHDILACTTIIESGLDIPRANTMIVNHADRFGLAQLYQLRGRIGRSRERAFCYLVVPEETKMTPEAKQRLAVLQRFTELGAGFQVATHDLEIRGAGELLGERQHGAVASVGFETYARILEEAVAELRGEPIEQEHDPEISVDVPAFLPDDFVPDAGQRLDFYRRLARARDEDDVRATLAELEDRYGALPEEALLLGEVMIDKTLVRRLGALGYELGPARLVLSLRSDTALDPAKVLKLVQAKASRFKLTPDMRLVVRLRRGREARPYGGGAGSFDAARGADHGLTSFGRFSGRLSRMYILLHMAVLTVTVLATTRIVPSVKVKSVGSAIVVALVFSVLNVFLGWLIRAFLIIPAILTLGLLFLFVPFIVNAVLLWLTDKLLRSFEIETFGGLFASAAIITVANWLFHMAIHAHFAAMSGPGATRWI